jgi:hypothetical protein
MSGPFANDQKAINKLLNTIRQQRAGGHSRPAPTTNEAGEDLHHLEDTRILELLFTEDAKGPQWEAVYAGGLGDYPSASEAVAAILRKLAFYTGNNPDQIERLIRASDLASEKFDQRRGHTTWIGREIEQAIKDTPEVYTLPGRGRYRYRYRLNSSSNGNGNDDEEGGPEGSPKTTSISFAELPEPEKPLEVWEGFIVAGWPALWFGGTGVTKSVTAMAVGQAIADENTKLFLGRDVITAPVMYADWELNAQVQGRRAYHIARGRGRVAPPPGLRYISTYGRPRRDRQDFLALVLDECTKHGSQVCFIDSVGLALGANPGDFEVIVDFFDEAIASFIAEGITPVLVDHQRRLIPGEKNQSLGAYGSVWKENLARTQLQLELVARDREAHTVTTRLRAKKTNFDELPEPVGLRTTFSEDSIKLEVVEIEAGHKAQEETLTARDRVFYAIQALEKAGPHAAQEATGLALSTVKKEITALRGEGKIEDTGEYEPGGGRIVTVTEYYSGNGNGNDKNKSSKLPDYNRMVEERMAELEADDDDGDVVF